jgi:hypothetical protein
MPPGKIRGRLMKKPWMIWAVALVLFWGVGLRLLLFTEPVRMDEAYSLLHFAVQPLNVLTADYSSPNNHILHSMAMHFTCRAFGLSDLGLRLPAFLAGTLTLALLIALAWELSRDKRVVFLSALFGCTSYPLVYYSVNGRGYSMQMLFTLAIALTLCRARHWKTPLIPIGLIALSLFGLLYTIPSGVVVALPLFLGGLFLAFLHRRASWAVYTFIAFGVCALLLVSAFGPMLRTLASNTPDLPTPPLRVFLPTIRMMADGVLPWPLCGIALLMGLWSLAGIHKDGARLMAIVLAGYPLLSLALGHWLPLPIMYDRSYTPLFPLAYVLIAMGVVQGGRLAQRFRPSAPAVFLLTVLITAYAARTSFSILNDPAKLYFPERPIMAAGRKWIPPLARTLQTGETIAGTSLASDAAAAYYVTQTRGFSGFYSLFEPRKRGLRTLYILSESPPAVQSIRDSFSSWGRWSPPETVFASAEVSLYRLRRLS